MKNYERPMLLTADQLSEGVYMLSGGEQYTAGEVLEAATETNTETVPAGAGGLEGSVGETPEPSEPSGGTDPGSSEPTGEGAPETAGAPASEGEAAAAPETDTPAAEATEPVAESASTGAEETGEMQGSMLINCDSRYMNGVWQAPNAGPWGELRKGCQEVLGCSGCPADKGDGCGLQDVGAAGRYFRQIGSLKPGWEASGKLPTDSPYGI